MKIDIKSLFDEIFAAPVGGDINYDACRISSNEVEIHCWDGRRFRLSLTNLPNGCKYDAKTGKKII